MDELMPPAAMRPRLIVDCGGRILSALLLTADGQIVPCSQQVRHVAARYVSSEVLFDPHVSEAPGFVWEEALEVLAKSSARNFFQRSRRVGLLRPWDERVSADAVPIASPLAVLSSPVAMADRAVDGALPALAIALLEALLEPICRFVAEQRIDARDVEPVVIVGAESGRRAVLALHKVFRRRGFRRLVVLRGDLATAMSLAASGEYLVCDVRNDDVRLSRLAVDSDGAERRFRVLSSETVRGIGWTYWLQQIGGALRRFFPSDVRLDRAVTALLTGAPQHLTHGMLDAALDDVWQRRQREELQRLLSGRVPALVTGDICGIAAIEQLFGAAVSVDVPMPERRARAVAEALLWMEEAAGRRLTVAPGGSLRLDSLRDGTAELLTAEQLPEPGHDGYVEVEVDVAGEVESGQPFLLHVLWGADEFPGGNATLCALPVSIPDVNAARSLRIGFYLRRGRAGQRLDGTLDVRTAPRAAAVARAAFTEELPAFRSTTP